MTKDTKPLRDQNVQLNRNVPRFRVELTYFRCRTKPGKYHNSGAYWTAFANLPQVWQEVREMLERRNLPGLMPGHDAYIVLVTIPEHEFAHPHLIVPTEILLAFDEES